MTDPQAGVLSENVRAHLSQIDDEDSQRETPALLEELELNEIDHGQKTVRSSNKDEQSQQPEETANNNIF